jgi:hypothetical protein
MAYYAEDLFYNHGKPVPEFRDIALTLVARHGLEADLKKVELIKELGTEFSLRENVYLTQDAFRCLKSPY